MKKHEPMTEEQLAAIKERCEEATPLPWKHSTPESVYSGSVWVCVSGWGKKFEQRLKDCDFIAHAREDVPALLAEVERLRAEKQRLEREADWLARNLSAQDSEYGRNPLCPMPLKYECKLRKSCVLCLAKDEKRAECWRKSAEMETRENTGDELKGHE